MIFYTVQSYDIVMTSCSIVNAVFTLILSADSRGEFLVGTETSSAKRGLTSLPGGKFDPEEDVTLFDTAVRECLEETGFKMSKSRLKKLPEVLQLQLPMEQELHHIHFMSYKLKTGEIQDVSMLVPEEKSNPLENLRFTDVEALDNQNCALIMSRMKSVLGTVQL